MTGTLIKIMLCEEIDIHTGKLSVKTGVMLPQAKEI